jgi:hypothetical protein
MAKPAQGAGSDLRFQILNPRGSSTWRREVSRPGNPLQEMLHILVARIFVDAHCLMKTQGITNGLERCCLFLSHFC